MSLPRLNLIGAGKLGRTLARLWHEAGLVEVGIVATRHRTSAAEAIAFIGTGIPTVWDENPSNDESANQWPEAEYWLLATGDDALPALARSLSLTRSDWYERLVFHCSGVGSADMLEPLAAVGALTASAHPVHSFADPQHSLVAFADSFCLIEGQSAATKLLVKLFTDIGAQPLVADHCNKPLYHAAMATASNLLVALLYSAKGMLAEATGLSPERSRELLISLSRQALDNTFRLGAPTALTGPVARGDAATITQHLNALGTQHPDWDSAYRSLSRIAVGLALAKGNADRDNLEQILTSLDELA